jgi:hypothetical protein
MTTTTRPEMNDTDALLARRFVDGIYQTIHSLDRAEMLRLVELGLIEEFRPGQFAETPKLRALGY